MPKIVIPFEITATNLNLLDTTDYTLVSLTSSGGYQCYVPRHLELWKDAGTAYTIGNIQDTNAGIYPPPDSGYYNPHSNLVQPLWPSRDLIIYDLNTHEYSNRTDINNIVFRIPIGMLLPWATGRGLVVFPVGGVVLSPGDLTLKVKSLVSISSGTGSLFGRLFLDEFPTKQ